MCLYAWPFVHYLALSCVITRITYCIHLPTDNVPTYDVTKEEGSPAKVFVVFRRFS